MFMMSGPVQRPGCTEIIQKFIKRPRGIQCLGVHYPFGAVVLCTLSYSHHNLIRREYLVFRSNGLHCNCHAEAQLLSYLRHHRSANSSRVIALEVFQNLSPCNDSDESCAQRLAAYKQDMENRGAIIYISIAFANFYRTTVYNGNPQSRAHRNWRGLSLLQECGIQLRMLTGEEEWKRLLWNDELVDLNEHQKTLCLAEAMSFEAVTRELHDRKLFYNIFGVAANRLCYEEMMNHFILPNDDQIVLVCRIQYLQSGRWYGPECLVLRSGVECAEAKLLHYLKMHDKHATRIEVNVIQNFFPCSERTFQGFSCVRNILSYKRDLEIRGKTICISFKLRSHSLVQQVTHDCDVQELLNNDGISFRPLNGRQDWETFLRDRQVVELNDHQVQDLLLGLSFT